VGWLVRRPRLRDQDPAIKSKQAVRGGTLLLAFILICSSALAETKTFKNSGLKNEIVVRLEIERKNVTGTFSSSEYDEDATATRKFSGKIIAAPRGKRGVFMRIQFEGEAPYSAPPGIKDLIWYLKIVNHRAHLFIPMQERSYGGVPKWIVSDVELEPAD